MGKAQDNSLKIGNMNVGSMSTADAGYKYCILLY